MSTPTPRTDRQAVVLLGKTWIASYDEMHEHARELERELAAEREKVQTIERENVALKREIEELKRQIEIDYWPLA